MQNSSTKEFLQALRNFTCHLGNKTIEYLRKKGKSEQEIQELTKELSSEVGNLCEKYTGIKGKKTIK